jgi:hypothetical protein
VAEKYEIKELHKQNMLLTAHILRKVLMYQCKVFIKGNSKAYTINCNNNMAPTLYKLEKWSVSSIYEYSKRVLGKGKGHPTTGRGGPRGSG